MHRGWTLRDHFHSTRLFHKSLSYVTVSRFIQLLFVKDAFLWIFFPRLRSPTFLLFYATAALTMIHSHIRNSASYRRLRLAPYQINMNGTRLSVATARMSRSRATGADEDKATDVVMPEGA